MGADELILLEDERFDSFDSYFTACVLATAIKKMAKYDIILCGREAADSDAGQVGPGIAEILEFLLYYLPEGWNPGTPDTPAAQKSYDAGEALYNGEDLSAVMSSFGYDMQEPDGLAIRLWPSELPGPGEIKYPPADQFEDSFFSMTMEELIQYAKEIIPGF